MKIKTVKNLSEKKENCQKDIGISLKLKKGCVFSLKHLPKKNSKSYYKIYSFLLGNVKTF